MLFPLPNMSLYMESIWKTLHLLARAYLCITSIYHYSCQRVDTQ